MTPEENNAFQRLRSAHAYDGWTVQWLPSLDGTMPWAVDPKSTDRFVHKRKCRISIANSMILSGVLQPCEKAIILNAMAKLRKRVADEKRTNRGGLDTEVWKYVPLQIPRRKTAG